MNFLKLAIFATLVAYFSGCGLTSALNDDNKSIVEAYDDNITLKEDINTTIDILKNDKYSNEVTISILQKPQTPM